MIFAFGLVASVVASAIAQDAPKAPVAQSPAYSDPQECDSVMSTLLMKKKDALDRRERSIKARESDILAAEERIKADLEKMNQIRNDMLEAMKDLDAQQLEEVERLVKMFQKMRGKQAAAILEQAEDRVALEVLRRMRDKSAGETLAAMNPKKAAKLTEMIAAFSYNPNADSTSN